MLARWIFELGCFSMRSLFCFNILMRARTVALLINYEWEQTEAKNHFNFRLHDQIDTIKQTDKNNDHIQRNKTNVRFKLHSLTGNAHFCRAWNLFWRKLPSFGAGRALCDSDGCWLQKVEIISEPARQSQTERRIECRNNVSIPASCTQLLLKSRRGRKEIKLAN